jgi:hypothetical protein
MELVHGTGLCDNHTCVVRKKNSISRESHSFGEIIYAQYKKNKGTRMSLGEHRI